jgi:hypothetical protein
MSKKGSNPPPPSRPITGGRVTNGVNSSPPPKVRPPAPPAPPSP